MYTNFSTIFILLLPFSSTSHHLGQPSPLGWTWSALLFSDFVEEKQRKDKNKNMTFLLIEIPIATQGVSYYISMYSWIVTPIGLYLLIFFILP
jgi:hypothetical protein